MIAAGKRGIRRLLRAGRSLLRRSSVRPGRLVVEKARWLKDADSPVMLMIDDLANVWHNRNGGDRWEAGGDWGGGAWQAGSALRFLEDGLLRDFPEARVTFFTVAGALSAYTTDQPFSYSAPLDATEESLSFFAGLASDPRFELAYHGFNHGTPGAVTRDFVQEWRGFPDRETATAQTRAGLAVFARATGSVPTGGKYGGWDYNDFAEEVLDICGFTWWCRDWMPREVLGRIPDAYYEPQFFGNRLLVALPSTVHGELWERRQVDLLLKRRQVISVEEHIAPIRPDGLIQTPNIVDDIEQLRGLYRYLRGKNVWHANGSEIAAYVIARERSLVYDATRDGFSLRYDGREVRPPLTLNVDCSAICTPGEPLIEITLPDGSVIKPENSRFDRRSYRHCVTVPVMDGRYQVRPATI